MNLELIPECEFTTAQHDSNRECHHSGLIKITRDDDSVRWLVDPADGTGHPRFIGSVLIERGEPGIVDTNPQAFYSALGVLAL